MPGPLKPGPWRPSADLALPGTRQSYLLAPAACAFCTVGVFVLGAYLGYSDVDVWGAFIVPTALMALSLPVLLRSRWLREERLATIAAVGLVAKFLCTYLRYLIENHVYPSGDSILYHRSGVRIAEEFLNGDRGLISLVPQSSGTRFIEELNGIVALLSGQSIFASSMIFSWLAFVGELCFISAALRACPHLQKRAYSIGILFLPTLLFWPTSLGKDAWMIFGMGIFANGVSRLLIGSPRGIVSSLLGGYLTALVRPHVTVLLLVAAAGAVGGRYLRNRLSATFLMVVLVSALSGVISSNSIELLPSFDSGFNAVLSSTREISSTGGSEFETASPNGILDYPVALVTVLFRPFLFEAGSGLQLLAAAESTALIVVIIGSRYRLAATIRSLLYVAYLRFSLIFVLGFGFAWASIGNYGILVRQRAQVMPFVLLLVFGSDLISQRKGPMEQILEARK